MVAEAGKVREEILGRLLDQECPLLQVPNYLMHRRRVAVKEHIEMGRTSYFMNSLGDIADIYMDTPRGKDQRSQRSFETPNLAVIGGHRTVWKPNGTTFAHHPHIEVTDELCVTLAGGVATLAAPAGLETCDDLDWSWTTNTGSLNFLPAGLPHTNAVVRGLASQELCMKLLPQSRKARLFFQNVRNTTRFFPLSGGNDDDAPTRETIPVVPLDDVSLAVAELAKDRSSVVATDPKMTGRVLRGEPISLRDAKEQVMEIQIWHMEHQIPDAVASGFEGSLLEKKENALISMGYSHLHAKVTFFGPGSSFRTHYDAYDLLIFPLTGNLTVLSGDDPTLYLVPGDFAIVPAGTLHGFQQPPDADPVAVLFVEIGSA